MSKGSKRSKILDFSNSGSEDDFEKDFKAKNKDAKKVKNESSTAKNANATSAASTSKPKETRKSTKIEKFDKELQLALEISKKEAEASNTKITAPESDTKKEIEIIKSIDSDENDAKKVSNKLVFNSQEDDFQNVKSKTSKSSKINKIESDTENQGDEQTSSISKKPIAKDDNQVSVEKTTNIEVETSIQSIEKEKKKEKEVKSGKKAATAKSVQSKKKEELNSESDESEFDDEGSDDYGDENVSDEEENFKKSKKKPTAPKKKVTPPKTNNVKKPLKQTSTTVEIAQKTETVVSSGRDSQKEANKENKEASTNRNLNRIESIDSGKLNKTMPTEVDNYSKPVRRVERSLLIESSKPASSSPLGKIEIKTPLTVRVGLSRNSRPTKPLHANVKPIN